MNKLIIPTIASFFVAFPAFAITIIPDTAVYNSNTPMNITCEVEIFEVDEGWNLYRPDGTLFGGDLCSSGGDLIYPDSDLLGEPAGVWIVAETNNYNCVNYPVCYNTIDEARNGADYVGEDSFNITALAAVDGMVGELPYGTFTANTASILTQVFPVVALSGSIALAFAISTWIIKRLSGALAKKE